MNRQIVADDSVFIRKIVKTFENHKLFTELISNWTCLGQVLDMDMQMQRSVFRKFHKTGQVKQIPRELLNCWSRVNGKRATLGVLCNALRQIQLEDLADDLENEFVSNWKESSDSSSDSSPESDTESYISLQPPTTENSNKSSSEGDKITIEIGKILGEGGRGTVFQGKFGRRPVAVKLISNISTNGVEAVEHEINMLIKCDTHQNIAVYFGMQKESQTFPIIYRLAIELCETNLREWIEQNKISREKLKENADISRLEILRQMTNGTQHLHCKRIIHRDLKPENVLLKNDSANGKILVKLTDFGISKLIMDGKTHHTSRSGAGTAGWMAPEVVQLFINQKQSAKLNEQTDIFSLGCLFYYVLTDGCNPFKVAPSSPTEYKPNFCLADFQDGTAYYNFFNLIKQMVLYEQKERPIIDDVKNHHVFWNHDKKLLFLTELVDYGKLDCKKWKNF